MSKQAWPDTTATSTLTQAIGRFAQTDGDHTTTIPALTLHRRKAPTEPLHCIYNLGLGVVAQGGKQVLLGGESIDYGPGQSMLTTIDLPVVSHVTRASTREPFLGLMLTLDARSILQIASEMDEPRPRREHAYRSISFEALDGALLDALVRLVKLLGEPALVPRLAPLIQQEITIRLLAGPHGPRLRHLVTAGSPSQQIAKAVAWLKQNSDGVLAFSTGAFAPGVTVQQATYKMWAIDGGLKKSGFSVNGQYYFRWLNDFDADGPLPVASTFDHGFELSTGQFIVPKKLLLYARGSKVFGQFGSPHEYAGGFKWYFLPTERLWLTGELMRVHNAPYSGAFSPYTAAMSGWVPMIQTVLAF